MISTIQDEPLFKNKVFLQQKYLSEGLSASQIAREISSARTTVSAHLAELEIQSNNKIQRGAKGQLAYGERTRNGKPDKHKRELENIQKMQKLREQGYSYWKIAEVFNSMGIPTKTRKAKWHPTTIMKILNHAKKIP